jgi:hypothetical protein
VLLPEIADPRIVFLVAMADVGGVIRRGIVGYDQLEILITLAEQRLDRLSKVILAIVDGKSNT